MFFGGTSSEVCVGTMAKHLDFSSDQDSCQNTMNNSGNFEEENVD